MMRGEDRKQAGMFSYISPEQRVPKDHPLRAIRVMTDAALKGTRLTCPRHGWEFDVQSGRCVYGGELPLRELPSRVEDGRLRALW